jgi:DNA-binding transcriptional MerR regulator
MNMGLYRDNVKPLSIGELARRTGVRPSALHYYEEAGILPTPARMSGKRCYDAARREQQSTSPHA